MKSFLKIVLIGILTTIVRIIGQFMIPDGSQSVLEPSIFAMQGTMPLVFTVYGIFAYSIIASLYLLLERSLTGTRIIKSLKFGISCAAVWTVYLWEPLPHVSPIDRITYPLADGIALLVMGILLGLLFSSKTNRVPRTVVATRRPWHNYFLIAACFIAGRLVLYLLFDIYSCFKTKGLETLVWTALTGVVVAVVVLWYEKHIALEPRIKGALLCGLVLFGVDLLLFNFFMPLVFSADIPDLILRTVIDILAVTAGLVLLARTKSGINPYTR